ncbi:MAG TPA: UTRA domain-containing protein, partial [Roseiarcus sp.]|nr:UTRA domain-containing protein [Roseiarcus sp.]
ALRIAEGSPCLVIERRTWRADEPVTYVKLTYPAEAHELVARFEPSRR